MVGKSNSRLIYFPGLDNEMVHESEVKGETDLIHNVLYVSELYKFRSSIGYLEILTYDRPFRGVRHWTVS
jgi:hypothetical protein